MRFSHTIFGRIHKDTEHPGLYELEDVCLCASSSDLRKIAAFICEAADKLEGAPVGCGVHLSDWLNINLKTDLIISGAETCDE